MNAIEVRGLMKQFDKKEALKGIDFAVPAGSIYGFLGPNGAGKTTTIKILMGLIQHDGGSVSLFGQELSKNREESRNRVGYLSQDPIFPTYYTGKEVMEMVSQLYKLEKNEATKRIQELLYDFKLEEHQHRRVNTYSRGMKQRLGLASVFLPQPELVLLDEPASALDPEGRAEVLNLMKEMRGQMTVFFSSHILADVERVCDHITIINQGEIATQAKTDELLSQYSPREYLIKVRPETKKLAHDILEKQPFAFEMVTDSQMRVWNPNGKPELVEEQILPLLTQQGVIISEFARETFDLERVFFEIIDGNTKDQQVAV